MITPKAPLGASELSPDSGVPGTPFLRAGVGAIYRWVEDDTVQVPEGRLSYVSHFTGNRMHCVLARK